MGIFNKNIWVCFHFLVSSCFCCFSSDSDALDVIEKSCHVWDGVKSVSYEAKIESTLGSIEEKSNTPSPKHDLYSETAISYASSSESFLYKRKDKIINESEVVEDWFSFHEGKFFHFNAVNRIIFTGKRIGISGVKLGDECLIQSYFSFLLDNNSGLPSPMLRAYDLATLCSNLDKQCFQDSIVEEQLSHNNATHLRIGPISRVGDETLFVYFDGATFFPCGSDSYRMNGDLIIKIRVESFSEKGGFKYPQKSIQEVLHKSGNMKRVDTRTISSIEFNTDIPSETFFIDPAIARSFVDMDNNTGFPIPSE